MIDVQTALKIIDEKISGIQKTVNIPVEKVPGRILAATVTASTDFPPYDNSAMDGYVLKKKDLDNGQTEFPVGFEIRPEHTNIQDLPPGTCAYITTGSVIPPGADFVVPVEMIRALNGQRIRVQELPARNPIRKKGEGYRKGDVLLPEGKYMNSADIGVLKSNGLRKISVFSQTRIALQVTGNELLDERRNTNGPVLQSWMGQLPSVSVDEIPPLADSKDASEKRFAELLDQYDMIVTTGGVSAGAYDLVIPALESQGVTFHVRGVRQKPGKPFAFGTKGEKIIVALPGNPISAFFCAVFYIGRIIKKRNGQSLRQQKAVLINNYSNKASRDEFVPAVFQFDKEKCTVSTRPGIQSHLLHHLSSANCFVHFKSGKNFQAGDLVSIIPFYE